jgi:signal transduction histidine kinase
MLRTQSHRFWRAVAACLCGAAAVAVATYVCFLFRLDLPMPTCLYMLVIVLMSARSSFVPSVLVSIMAASCLDYFFLPPVFSFELRKPHDYVALVVFLTTSFVITNLVSRVRELTQDKLQRSEAYLSEAQRLSHTGSFGWRVPTGEILWSEETFRIFQLDRMTKPTVELVMQRVHPEDTAFVKETIERASQDGKNFDLEHRLLMPDGSVKHLDIAAHAETDKSGKLEFIGAVMDITGRKRADEDLRKAQSNLAHVSRLTTMGELAASIAHEVKQPLAAIVTNANACLRWLDREPPNLEEARDAVRRIVRDGNRGNDVITRIRALLKKEPPPRVRLDVNEIIRETIACLRGELQGVSLQTQLAGGLPNVTADRVQLQQVMLNLTLNAIDAMKPLVDRPRVLRIQTKDHERGAILVEVQDSGIGLNPKQMEQLFETFYTTKPEGLGMGLSICRSIIEGYGGRLWAESKDGSGASFQFTLPIESGGTA